MKTKSIFKFGLLVCTLSFLNSCVQNDSSTDDLTSTAGENSTSTSINDEIINTSDNLYTQAMTIKTASAEGINAVTISPLVVKGDSGSVSITLVSTSPLTYILDFGTGYKNRRGTTIMGKMKMVVDIAKLSRTITFIDFKINGNKVSGNKTVTYSPTPVPTWTIEANDTIVKASDGKTITFKSNRVRKFIVADSTFSITGTCSGVNAKGKSYTGTINEDLIIRIDYPYIVKGKFSMLVGDMKSVVVDYGDGTKDNKATVTINGKSHDITLK